MNPEDAKALDQAMVDEISAARMTITERTARNWLRKLGFKFRTKVRYVHTQMHTVVTLHYHTYRRAREYTTMDMTVKMCKSICMKGFCPE